MKALCDELVRPVLRVAFYLYRLVLLVRRPKTFSAHALALTGQHRVVLVKLRYARGWRLPGGGHSRNETARQAVLRELREEIGLVKHGQVQLACEFEDHSDVRRDRTSMLIVSDVEYRPPKWSWEVEDVIETPVHQLPRDLAPSAAWLLRTFLRGESRLAAENTVLHLTK